MATIEVSVAAATAVVGYNLLTNKPEVASSNVPRALTGAALAGSAAAQDTEVSLRVGMVEIARLLNQVTGGFTKDHLRTLDAYIPPGMPISAIVLDAAATNPIQLSLELEDLV